MVTVITLVNPRLQTGCFEAIVCTLQSATVALLCTMYCVSRPTVYNVLCIVSYWCPTLYNVLCITSYCVQCTVYRVLLVSYSVQCTVYSNVSTLHNLFCQYTRTPVYMYPSSVQVLLRPWLECISWTTSCQ